MERNRRANILVVDDEPGIRRALTRVLSRRYETDAVGSAEEAIRKLEEKEYDIAIVDLRMPGMDGFQLLRTIKLYRPQTEVIIMSGSASEEKLIEAIREQAFYFVTKPFQKEVIETLVERCVWTQWLQQENLAYVMQLQSYLEQAKEFQGSLMPVSAPQTPGVRYGVRYVPSEVLGGDFYDFYPIPGRAPSRGFDPGETPRASADARAVMWPGSETRVALMIADVFGHGVLAAMRTGIVKSLLAEAVRENSAPASVLRAINKGMNRFGGESPLTAFYGVLDLDLMSLSYVNAGHPGPLLYRQTGEVEILDSTVPLLGARIAMPEQPESKIEVAPGDTLVLYTDGIIEAINREHRWFGLDNLKRVVWEHIEQPPQVLADAICRAARRFAIAGLPPDDVTAIVLRFEEVEWSGPII